MQLEAILLLVGVFFILGGCFWYAAHKELRGQKNVSSKEQGSSRLGTAH